MTQPQVIDLNAYRIRNILQQGAQDLPNPEPIRTVFRRCKCRLCEGQGLLRVINIYGQPVQFLPDPLPEWLRAFPINFEVALASRGTLPPHMQDFACWECSGIGAVWREVQAQGEAV